MLRPALSGANFVSELSGLAPFSSAPETRDVLQKLHSMGERKHPARAARFGHLPRLSPERKELVSFPLAFRMLTKTSPLQNRSLRRDHLLLVLPTLTFSVALCGNIGGIGASVWTMLPIR
jgi:hypothetical protein